MVFWQAISLPMIIGIIGKRKEQARKISIRKPEKYYEEKT